MINSIKEKCTHTHTHASMQEYMHACTHIHTYIYTVDRSHCHRQVDTYTCIQVQTRAPEKEPQKTVGVHKDLKFTLWSMILCIKCTLKSVLKGDNS